tara:strand:+ start:240 stop:1274 length:1035 start_codon:yes stop_codon:yes gene_type:complete
MAKKAVILFNLGGPDSPEAVEPFLFNLFYDPAIIRLPTPLRWLVAKLISRRRAPIAQDIYAELGGSSPILPETEAQARALESALAGPGGADSYRVFIVMRYWHPFAAEVAKEVKAWQPDEVLLLPLYPQFSTTTTESSFNDWTRAAKSAGLTATTRAICCYPVEAGFIAAHAALIAPKLDEMAGEKVRLLFSAHGLPQKIVDAGDPYQRQVEETAAAIVATLDRPDLDWRICYQSRVGPLKWLEPSTEAEIARAGGEGISLIVVPIAFVSEHSETLVELDIEYGKLARVEGVAEYHRIRTLGIHPEFINGLVRMVLSFAGAPEMKNRPDFITSDIPCDCLPLAS